MSESIKQALVKDWHNPKEFKWEKNDCTVHCVRHAFDISYELAWRLCNAHGRVPTTGFHFRNDLLPALNVIDLCSAFKGMTLNQALPLLSLGGAYIVAVKGHVFCVKEGEILNHESINYHNIEGVWRVR